MAKAPEPARKTVAENRKARFEYHVEDVYEAGIMLTGSEVKSLRKGGVNIGDSYAAYEDGGLHLVNAYIPEIGRTVFRDAHDPRRRRKLLMHASEIAKLTIAIERKGYTLVPLELYFNAKGIAKLKIALAEGKNKADKREADKKRDWNREKARLMREKG
jgi:SsrA-binding protein